MKIFIAGPRSIKKLDKVAQLKLENIIKENHTVLVGDAIGVDKLTQQFLSSSLYNNVIFYASQGKARNNLGGWRIEDVPVKKGTKGFDFYKAKDIKMAEDADYGFMIWNGKSKGTLNNIINLAGLNKKISVYFIPHEKFYIIRSIEDAKIMVSACGDEIANLFNELRAARYPLKDEMEFEQLTVNETINKDV
ncbi:hypothetical protein MASR2M70_03580 [Bacillota bacterium]